MRLAADLFLLAGAALCLLAALGLLRMPDVYNRIQVATKASTLGVAFLQAHGYKKVVLESHSLGCSMVERYLELNPNAPVQAWLAIGAPGALGSGTLKFPILDLSGGNDLPEVLQARARRAKVKGAFTQIVAPGVNHFFDGHDNELLDYVRAFLDKTL